MQILAHVSPSPKQSNKHEAGSEEGPAEHEVASANATIITSGKLNVVPFIYLPSIIWMAWTL